MKKDIKSGLILLCSALLLSGCAGSTLIAQEPDDTPVTYQVFYDNLSPYGTWIDYPEYGLVWNPRITDDFRPYATNGYWVFSTGGWAWVSGYSWGWATFHYGCWLYDDVYGWLWIPGYEWSPAWVTWGFFDNYYCWAPLMPGVFLGAGYGPWRPHSFYWNACRRDRIYDRHPVIERPQATNLDRISIVDNFGKTSSHSLVYSKGPEIAEVQQHVHQKIDPVTIREINKIGRNKQDGNTIKVYRPVLQDPKKTLQQHPQRVSQPREFRKVEPAKSIPINNENQRPVRQPVEQRTNIERLPVQRRGR
ncbi:MAG: DUF6600 domain-containing protein [Taibaiella sp.]